MKSQQRPWVRAGLLGLVPWLLPFAWVVELDSCGSAPHEDTQTGLALVSRFPLEDWLVIVPVLAVMVLTPFLARALRRPVFAWVTHLVGLAASGLSMWGVWLVFFFSIFTSREARGAGWVVIGLFASCCVDAGARVVWSTREWLALRRKPMVERRPA